MESANGFSFSLHDCSAIVKCGCLQRGKTKAQEAVAKGTASHNHAAGFLESEKLEVVNAWIVDQETGYPAARVEIRKNSEKDVMMVDLMSGEGGIT